MVEVVDVGGNPEYGRGSRNPYYFPTNAILRSIALSFRIFLKLSSAEAAYLTHTLFCSEAVCGKYGLLPGNPGFVRGHHWRIVD